MIFVIIAGLVLLFLVEILYFAGNYFYKFGIARNNYISMWDNAPLPKNQQDSLDKLIARSGNDELMKSGMRWMLDNDSETVHITSFDGLRLEAHIIDCSTPRGVLILMHGFRGSGVCDFAPIAEFYHKLGFILLVPEQRAQGNSEGQSITFGIKERFDCRDFAQYAAKRYGGDMPIILDGVSMGAATVLMASGLELPKSVCGIIADCGFTSPKDIFYSVLKNGFKLPPYPVLWVAGLMVRRRAGFKINEYTTIEALKKNRLPLLLVHGTADDFVPIEMSDKNYEAAKDHCDATLVRVEGAGHGMSYLADTESCNIKLADFIDKCINKLKTE